MANKEEIQERLDVAVEELTSGIPELRHEFQTRIELITADRDQQHFDAVVIGDEESQAAYAAAVDEIAALEDKLVAVDLREQQLNGERVGLQHQLSEVLVQEGLALGGKYEKKMSVIAEEVRGHILAAGQGLLRLRTLSVEAQNRLTEANLSDEQMGPFRWRTLKSEFSQLALLAFGRIAKLNMNTSIGPGVKRWWAEMTE